MLDLSLFFESRKKAYILMAKRLRTDIKTAGKNVLSKWLVKSIEIFIV